MTSIREHSLIVPLLLFGVAAVYFISLSSTVPTFYNVNSDSPIFITAAKFFRISHPSPGSPLYNLINMAWLHGLPFFSSEYYSLTILNALYSSAVTAVLYAMTRNILAPLIWLAAGVVVTQSTILEQYSLTVLFMLVSYWCYRNDKRSWAYGLASFGIMVNHLAGFCILAYLANDVYQKNTLKPFLWSFIALPLLAYIPLLNRAPYVLIDGNSIFDYYNYLFGGRGLIGGLAIIPTEDFVDRIWAFTRLILGGLGASLILIIIGIKKTWKVDFVLHLLFLFPAFYYFTDLDATTYTYTTVSIAFGSILACKYDWKFAKVTCIIGAIVLIGFNIQWYDFGRTLDADQTHAEWYETLDMLPDNAVIQTDRAGCCTLLWIDLYNLEKERNIINIKRNIVDTHPLERYKLIDVVKQAENEGRLYESIVTDTETYSVKTFQIKSDDLIKFIQDPYAPRKPMDEKIIISQVR